MTVNVLFVCLGNICRSPTAHGLFQNHVEKAGLAQHIFVDSAGTGGWHIGHPPDSRAQATALQRGYDISDLQARVVTRDDFNKFDYILGMDKDNVTNLLELKPHNYTGTLGLFLQVAGIETDEKIKSLEVPDPYYGDQTYFENAIQLIDSGAAGLLSRIQNEQQF